MWVVAQDERLERSARNGAGAGTGPRRPDFKVFLVDDDVAVLKALERLLGLGGYAVEAFSSAAEFLAAANTAESGCAIIDLTMPELGGLELQSLLVDRPVALPVIFLTGTGDIPASVQAMKAGAIDFLVKPANRKQLLQAIERAAAKDLAQRQQASERSEVAARLATLTPREHEVMNKVVAGLLNKQIAAELGASIKTIKVHRGRVMAKMGARTVADLVRLAAMAQHPADASASWT